MIALPPAGGMAWCRPLGRWRLRPPGPPVAPRNSAPWIERWEGDPGVTSWAVPRGLAEDHEGGRVGGESEEPQARRGGAAPDEKARKARRGVGEERRGDHDGGALEEED